jgi:hypothetical protein
MTTKPYLLAFALFSSLSLNISCSKDHDTKQANEQQTKALELHVKPLAETSVERSCSELYDALKDYSATYLSGAEVIAGEGFFDGCDQLYAFGSFDFNMGFTLKNTQTSLGLQISIMRRIDSNRNLIGTMVHLSRVSTDKREVFVPIESDKLLGENIVHLKSTLEAWASPSNKPIFVFGKTEADYNKQVVSIFGIGTAREFLDEPGLKIELVPSTEDNGQGSVKFLNVDSSYFKIDPSSSLNDTKFLDCPDVACLNEGVTYEITGNIIRLISKPHVNEKGVTSTLGHFIYVSADDLG